MHTVRFDGDKLQQRRLARKFDQSELAFRARRHGSGITQSQISRYENGQEPSGRNAIALSLALECEVTELYSADDDDEEAALASRTRWLSADLLQLARVAGILERRPDLVEDILAAEVKQS